MFQTYTAFSRRLFNIIASFAVVVEPIISASIARTERCFCRIPGFNSWHHEGDAECSKNIKDYFEKLVIYCVIDSNNLKSILKMEGGTYFDKTNWRMAYGKSSLQL